MSAPGRYCCKTILSARASNIDSRIAIDTQHRFENSLATIRLLRASLTSWSFATVSAHVGRGGQHRQSPVIVHDRTCRERAPTAEFDPEQKSRLPAGRAEKAKFNSKTSPLIQTSKPAKLVPLDGSHRRLMSLISAFNQLERRAEYFAERSGIVTDDRQAAAPFGTIRSERPDDDVATGTHGSQDPLGIGGPILRISQEMKSCAVVPYVVGLGWFPGRHVRCHPVYFRASRAEPCLRCCERLFGKVENGDSLKSLVQKSIDQPRCATANIND
jgi:hypothetical protein